MKSMFIKKVHLFLLTALLLVGASNAFGDTLWSEDFSSFSTDAIPSGGTYSYACTNGDGTSPGTTAIKNASLAGGVANELMIGKKGTGGTYGGSFSATIPLVNIAGTLTLKYKQNDNTLKVTMTAGSLTSSQKIGTSAEQTLTLDGVTTDITSVTIVFEATTTSNVRLDDIVLKGMTPSTLTAPSFSVEEGTYTSGQNVTLIPNAVGETIYYTTDGSEPDNESAVYSSPISVEETTTIKAISYKGSAHSAVVSATYTLKVPAPTIWPGTGIFVGTQNIYMSCDEPETTIYYTITGTTPTTSSSVYSGPISLLATATIKAIAVKDNWTNSDVTMEICTIVSQVPDSCYIKVTSDLGNWSGEYLIVYESGNLYLQGGLGSSMDRANNSVPTTISNQRITSTKAVNSHSFTIEKLESGDFYSIKSASGYYIGNSGSGNGLSTSTTAFDNTISYDNGVSVICNGYELRYNYSSNQQRFRYYSSGQQPIQLYRKEARNYLLNVSAAGWASMILPFDAKIPEGVTAYYASAADEEYVTVVAIGGDRIIPAGTGVIVRGTGMTTYNFVEKTASQSITSLLEGSTNGTEASVGANNVYVLSKDEIGVCFAEYTRTSIASYKAYLPKSSVSSSGAPMIRFIEDGENNTTDVDVVQKASVENSKVLINGQLFIIRDGITYDVMGRIVK